MLICIIFSAYFSATETAFSSLNKTRLKVMAEKGNKRAKLACDLSEKYDKLISTILIGNNIVNIAVSSIGTLLFVALIGNMGATVSTVVITVAVLIFGEIIPKSLAKDFPEEFAMFSSPIIRLIMFLFAPLNVIFSGLKKLVSKLFGSKQDNKMSQEELLMFIEEVEQEGSLDESEGELIRNAVEFGDLTAQDILTHRVNLEAVNVNSTKEEVAEAFTESRYSRLLVYEDSIDKIVGVIHQKDFYCGTGVTDKPVTEYMTPPVFIAPTQKIDDLLETLQRAKAHIAVVLDEYGGTLGIVTMEDILEELVGEIWDEHDEVEEPVEELAEDTFSVDCTISLVDFSDRFDLKIEAESVSLGGWVTEQVEHIPEVGESFEYENLLITVTAADDHKVDTVKVEIREPAPVEEE
ncbi:MAG: HlyC/CorC family transporter [Clostridia bacterium]|nr:HlyC/CorC family transporter [Clostridia bacterium]